MKHFGKIKKILWAVDAFQKRDANLKNVARHVEALARLFGAKIEIASACSFPEVFMDAQSFAILERPYLDQAEKNLSRIAALFSAPTPVTAVLANSHGGKTGRDDAGRIAAHAKKRGCDLIAVATHARGTVAKFFVGSFAEDLLAKSPLPLVLIGPHHKVGPSHRVKTALFPTDFSKSSEKALKSFLPLARANDLSVRLVNDLSEAASLYVPAVTAEAALMGGFYPMNATLFETLAKRRTSLLKKWLAACRAAKVRAGGEIYRSGAGVPDVICRAAKSDKADLIVLTRRSEGILKGFFNGVVRKVVRNAAAPVIAWHV
jgi:nucleotide-binding universal stress UspA family protein